jgi:hypothetical protein
VKKGSRDALRVPYLAPVFLKPPHTFGRHASSGEWLAGFERLALDREK